ncbi:MAG: PepSY domain-containing protein [Pseudomonadota bacterium]
MSRLKLLALAVTATTIFGAHSIAFSDDQDDIRMLQESKISLIQAIQLAEKDQNGTAIQADLDDDSFSPTYEVTIMRENRFYDVRIDAVKGEVTGAREDKDD